MVSTPSLMAEFAARGFKNLGLWTRGVDTDLFTPEDDGTPQMWATHPSNYDREQNAKAYYIRSTIDNRSAWVLFKDPQQLGSAVPDPAPRASTSARPSIRSKGASCWPRR